MKKYKVGVLGATGAVGQRFIQLLENHPWFEINHLFASERSAGKTYTDAVEWRLPTPMPEAVKSIVVKPCEPQGVETDLVFSARAGNSSRK